MKLSFPGSPMEIHVNTYIVELLHVDEFHKVKLIMSSSISNNKCHLLQLYATFWSQAALRQD